MRRILSRALAVLLLCLLTFPACKPSTGSNGDSDADTMNVTDADHDATSTSDADQSGEECEDNADCDDSIECTEDLCGAGNICRHIPFDDRCPEDMVCRETRGCVDPNECEEHEDCDDHVFCNGTERCVGGTCFAGEARTCDDGDECTNDWCNVGTDSCVHDPLPSCLPDGGSDSGVDPFDPEEHYSGSFELLPHPNSVCLAATFNIITVTFSSTPDELTITAGAFPMTQTPRPDDESFDVTYRQPNCGDYRLVGSFINSNVFSGQWTASFFGSCGMCDNQDLDVTGVRN